MRLPKARVWNKIKRLKLQKFRIRNIKRENKRK